MAHWAEINENNIVVRVLVTNNDLSNDGKDFVNSIGGTWIQTSYNSTIRKNFASPGMKYDLDRDAFIYPKPFPSWTLNEDTCRWEAPTPMPINDNQYNWDEAAAAWVVLVIDPVDVIELEK
jgi:hypothetical protein